MERLSRNQRRQILKDDEPWIGKPLNAATIGRGLQANARHLAIMLRDTQIKRRATKAAAFAAQLMDATVAGQIPGPVACGMGCHHCCKTYVSATVPEILRVAQALRGKSAKIEEIAAAATSAKTIPQNLREVQRLACPVLDNGNCSEYPSRPFVCRSVLSKSLEACVRIFAHNADEAFPHADNSVDIRTYIVVLMQASLVLAGLPHSHFELIHGLATALAHDDTEERWLRGEPVFADVAADVADTAASKLSGLVRKLVSVIAPTI